MRRLLRLLGIVRCQDCRQMSPDIYTALTEEEELVRLTRCKATHLAVDWEAFRHCPMFHMRATKKAEAED